MDKRILNEVRRNRELMGISEQNIIGAVESGVESVPK